MLQQHVLNFDPCNVVTRTDDQVISPRLKPEVSILVHAERVAGEVPSILHVFRLLAFIIEILASGNSANSEAAYFAGSGVRAVVTNDLRLVAMDRSAGSSGSNLLFRCADKNLQHLGRTDAVNNFFPCRLVPRFEGR